MIIGISGKIGSGKSTISRYISMKYGFRPLSTSGMLKSILESNDIEINRENLQKIGDELISVVGGSGFIAIMLAYLPPDNYLIDSIRHVGALNYLRLRYGDKYYHIHVESCYDLRFLREKNIYGETIEHFRQIESANTEQEIDALKNLADVAIVNDIGINDVQIQIDLIMKHLIIYSNPI